MPRPAPSRVAAALNYLERLKNQAAEFGGGVVENLADRARSVGGLAYEALTSDPAIGRMTTAEFSEAASRPTPRLDQAARDIGTIGRAIVTQPIQTGKAIVQGEVERAQQAMTSPRAAGEYAGSFIDPMRIAAALRRTAPVLELDVYHGTPHRFEPTEANPLGEFDASKIGTGEGGSVYGKGTYFTSSPKFAKEFARHVGEPRLSLKGQELERGTPDYEAAMLVDSMGLQEAQKYVKRATTDKSEKVSGHFKTVDAALSKITKKSDVKNLGLGQIYKADLPDEMIEKMIVYDKPINKQSNYVKAALEKAGINTQTSMYAGPMTQGQEKALAAAGIPGMVYREKGGPRNFVVFPGEEKKVRILERK